MDNATQPNLLKWNNKGSNKDNNKTEEDNKKGELLVMQCSNCERYYKTPSSKTATCPYCNKKETMKGRVIHHRSSDPKEVARAVYELNFQMYEEKRIETEAS